MDLLVQEKQAIEVNQDQLYEQLKNYENKLRKVNIEADEYHSEATSELKRRIKSQLNEVFQENSQIKEELKCVKERNQHMQDEIFRLKEQVNTFEILNIRQKVAKERLQINHSRLDSHPF